MTLAKRISKFTIVGLTALILLSVFLPLYTYKQSDSTSNVYLYRSAVEYLGRESFYISVFAALIFSPLILFAAFKNRDFIAVALMLFACLYLLFIVFAINENIKNSTSGGYKKGAGLYLLAIATVLQVITSIAHTVFCLLDNHFKERLTSSSVAEE